MPRRTPESRHGSIYLITLLTVVAIVSMVLLGVALRQSTNNDSAIIELMSENSGAPFDASEYAIARIYDSPDWITDAQKGAVFSDFTLGDRTYTSTVLDADTLSAPTDATTVYRVGVGSTHGSARASARFDLHYERFDYYGFVDKLDLQHYWPLNEKNNPAKADDKKTGSYDGTYTAPSVAGKGTNDEEGWVPVFASYSNGADRVEINHGTDFRQGRASISMWVKWTGTTAESLYFGILGMLWDNSTPSLGMGIFNGRISAYISDDGSVSYPDDFAFGSPFTANTWHHVVLNWGNPGLEIYVDGVREAVNASADDGMDTKVMGPLGLGGYRASPLLIGAGFDPLSSWGMKGFKGSIAHVVMFNEPLSASTVAKLAAQKPDEVESDIIEGSWVRVFE